MRNLGIRLWIFVRDIRAALAGIPWEDMGGAALVFSCWIVIVWGLFAADLTWHW